MLNLIFYKLKDYRQSLPMILVMTAMALVLIYVFGRGFEGAGQPYVALVDEDQSAISRAYIQRLKALEGYDYVQVTREEALEGLEEAQFVGVILIDEGFGEDFLLASPEIALVVTGHSVEQQFLEQQLVGVGRIFSIDEQFVQAFSKQLAEQGADVSDEAVRRNLEEQVEKYPIMEVVYESYDGGEVVGYDSMKHSFIGFILFFSTFSMVFGVGSMVEEKENGVWPRLMVSPLPKVKVFLANLISAYLIGMLQLGLMILISRQVFGLDWGGSLGALFLILSGYVLAICSLGFLLSNLVKTSQQLGAFSPVIVVSTSMLGGCMWPLEIIESKVLLFLADLTPQRWAYLGMERVILNNAHLGDVLGPLGVLVLISLILFGLSLIPYDRMPALKKVTGQKA